MEPWLLVLPDPLLTGPRIAQLSHPHPEAPACPSAKVPVIALGGKQPPKTSLHFPWNVCGWLQSFGSTMPETVLHLNSVLVFLLLSQAVKNPRKSWKLWCLHKREKVPRVHFRGRRGWRLVWGSDRWALGARGKGKDLRTIPVAYGCRKPRSWTVSYRNISVYVLFWFLLLFFHQLFLSSPLPLKLPLCSIMCPCDIATTIPVWSWERAPHFYSHKLLLDNALTEDN